VLEISSSQGSFPFCYTRKFVISGDYAAYSKPNLRQERWHFMGHNWFTANEKGKTGKVYYSLGRKAMLG
jgi:hypothetical protein